MTTADGEAYDRILALLIRIDAKLDRAVRVMEQHDERLKLLELGRA